MTGELVNIFQGNVILVVDSAAGTQGHRVIESIAQNQETGEVILYLGPVPEEPRPPLRLIRGGDESEL